MSDTPFLRTILGAPDDTTPRSIYIDWLDERNDPAADFMRSLERGSRDAIPPECDPEWLAFVTTLGRPFVVPRPNFDFFYNCQVEQLPFSDQIGLRGRLMTFASQFRDEAAFDADLLEDLKFLTCTKLGECYSGAANLAIQPFMCEFPDSAPITGSKVLRALHARDFRSNYIESLEVTQISFPGYHPGDGSGNVNDEIHTDFTQQYLFKSQTEEGQPVDETDGVHGLLKTRVENGALWYVLLHMVPERYNDSLFSNYVVLFAVGKSRRGNRLIGGVTHQVCHNLCD